MLSIAVSGDTSKRELTEEEIESVALWCVEKMKAIQLWTWIWLQRIERLHQSAKQT
jgi:hypothetical protein